MPYHSPLIGFPRRRCAQRKERRQQARPPRAKGPPGPMGLGDSEGGDRLWAGVLRPEGGAGAGATGYMALHSKARSLGARIHAMEQSWPMYHLPRSRPA